MTIAHGIYKLELKGRVIECSVYGSWNLETTLAYVAEHKALIASLQGHRWAKILDLSEWGLGIPEVVAPIAELYAWSVLNGQVRQLNVHHNSLFKDFHLTHVIPENTPVVIENIANWDLARQTLQREGFYHSCE